MAEKSPKWSGPRLFAPTPAHMTSVQLIFTPLAVTMLMMSISARGDDVGVDFESHILPILEQRCGKCHGKKLRKGDLDLSSLAAIRRGGESGEPAIAESADESLLWVMIEGGEMPPEGETRLLPQEKKLIHQWISSGAATNALHSSESKKLNQHDVLPIVLLRCVTCHGARQQRGGFDARTPESMRKGGKSGPAIVKGNPDQSLMIKRIESQACPPSELLLKYFVRRPPTSEVKKLRDWIAAGTPEEDVQPDVATTEPDPLVSDEDRQHWAFQPPEKNPAAISIDEFILRRLQQAGLHFSPEADRDTLIRRAYIDLVGIPPTVKEWNRWHNATGPDWFARMIDHLLASPHYGERWGRYWLDVAGYADSEGGVSSDPVRQVAWKYRDYVVSAFNSDKPYDCFLLEQIAGDELIDHANAKTITPQMVEHLIATGFLRMGIDQTGSRTMNFVPERLGVIDDALTVLGSGVMGLTIGCARCHSHKYDAIPHRDYYRLKAVFQGAFDEHDWLSFKNRSLAVDTVERVAKVKSVNAPLTIRIKKLQAAKKKAEQNVQMELLRHHYPKLTSEDRAATLKALRIADNNRSQPQRILVEKLQTAEVIPDESQPESVRSARAAVADIEAEIDSVQRQMEPALAVRALWDRGAPSPTYILRRGEHNKPGPLVGPGVPSVLTNGRTPLDVKPPFPGGTRKTGRRLAFARWLTEPNHPLTARVFVNRVWYHHFGTGLVKSLENFGKQAAPPSHPVLLDWLAVTFVENGWSIKELHRTIMNSRTYRQSSHVTKDRLSADPQNTLISRMPLRRMDAEALRDSLLLVSGLLDETSGGPPDKISVNRNGLVSIKPTPDGRWRRSIYAQYRRTEIPSVMSAFDYPVMGPNCVSRTVSNVSPQALLMMNNDHIRNLSTAFAKRVASKESEPSRQIELVYQTALSRNPSDEERQLGADTLSELIARWNGNQLAALETYCHTILNTAAFTYID